MIDREKAIEAVYATEVRPRLESVEDGYDIDVNHLSRESAERIVDAVLALPIVVDDAMVERAAYALKTHSLTQPWATLVATGAKRIETRSWRTPYRGWLGIHASKGFPPWAQALCDEEPFVSALHGLTAADLPRGALVGGVRLLDCVPTTGTELAAISEREIAFGDYGAGRWAWLLDRATVLKPRPMRGSLGLWPIPQEPDA